MQKLRFVITIRFVDVAKIWLDSALPIGPKIGPKSEFGPFGQNGRIRPKFLALV